MNPPEEHLQGNAEIWRRFCEAVSPRREPAEVDPCLLAGYLDGTADPAEVEAVERAMAADPSLVEAIQELRDLREAEPAAVSESTRARIKASLSAASARREGGAWGRVWWRRAIAAAAIIAMSFLGYQLGLRASETADSGNADLMSAIAAELQWDSSRYDPLSMIGDGNGHANEGGRQ